MNMISAKLTQSGLRRALSRSAAQVAAKGTVLRGMQSMRMTPQSSSLAVSLTFSHNQRFLSLQAIDATNVNVDEKVSGMISQNITHNAFNLLHRKNYCSYDQDYDADNLHQTPSSITSQDNESLTELEMIRHEDVGSADGGEDTHFSYYDEYHEHHDFEADDDDCYEFEENWEIMHTVNSESGDAGPCEVLDNVDDVNDFCY